jgi:hypothetical protein
LLGTRRLLVVEEMASAPHFATADKCRPRDMWPAARSQKKNALKPHKEEGLLRALLGCQAVFSNEHCVCVGDGGHGQVFSPKGPSVGVRFGSDRAPQKPHICQMQANTGHGICGPTSHFVSLGGTHAGLHSSEGANLGIRERKFCYRDWAESSRIGENYAHTSRQREILR